MKLYELNKEQAEKLCDYILDRDCSYDEQGHLINLRTMCKNCPFSFYVGEINSYDCRRPDYDSELPQEFVDIIKKD